MCSGRRKGNRRNRFNAPPDATPESWHQGWPMSMTAFALALADVIQRPVIDETHLQGTFHFDLSW
jgi:uncharacterized protein (TIGR03435 family)